MAVPQQHVRASQKCEDERCQSPDSSAWFCADCDSFFCFKCWPFQVAHKPEKVGRDGVPHEKANYEMFKLYKDILDPGLTGSQLQQLHEEDSETLWFGVTKNEHGPPNFEDRNRLASLMADSPSEAGTSGVKYPQLVSFIGETSAGKSTIVKMLINHQPSESENFTDRMFSSPVVGTASNDKEPTSGDVHLYSDPATYSMLRPILYADCEGLQGGENVPLGAGQARKQLDPSSGRTKLTKPRPISSRWGGKSRKIAWATDDDKQRREYMVRELFPRLLYTFSDNVVFVLRNARAFQSAALGRLLAWGAASLEKSVNQPTLPHAVVVLNGTSMGVDQREWDPDFATLSLLDTVKHSLDRVNGVPEMQSLVYQWKHERGVNIKSVEDLIRRYYSSFTVVRVPEAKGHYTLMHEQIEKLHKVISANCLDSFTFKRNVRMLSNTDELNVYLQAAYDHFTTNLSVPFNFIDVSLKNNPLPETFGDHITQFAVAIFDILKRATDRQPVTGGCIFTPLSSMVASCIMLDCVQYRKGTVGDLFDNYRDFLEEALERFCRMHWPCEYVGRRGRCVNSAATHGAKGHQNSDGRVIGTGDYRTVFSFEQQLPRWLGMVKTRVLEDQEELRRRDDANKAISSTKHALAIHRERMEVFFTEVGGAQRYISHLTCFCCLKNVPEHPLQCGHILCSVCVRAYGQQRGDLAVTLESCPLHHTTSQFGEPWRIALKPDYAGVRILSLDGGGIRGIIELEVLKAIQFAIGHDLPIHAFFDLMVGTSTGGIIALALGVKQWSIDDCIKQFVYLCGQAFTERELHGVHFLEKLVTLHHGSKYKTRPLHDALRLALGEEPLFGGPKYQGSDHAIKVAVTATSGTGKQPLVIANYSRSDDDTETEHPYNFIRRDTPLSELQVCEAAAATSAAPGYFKEFYHRQTNQIFLDGALYHNCPAQVAHRESRLIWPDTADMQPDILLSIGTGMDGEALEEEPSQDRVKIESILHQQREERLASATGERSAASGPRSWLKPSKSRLVKTMKALYQRIENAVDAERAWREFEKWARRPELLNLKPLAYARVNPDLGGKTPKLDAKDEIHNLRQRINRRLQSQTLKPQVLQAAFQLVASTFYFSKSAPLRTIEGGAADATYECLGTICCRFENNPPLLRNLGRFLQDQQQKDLREQRRFRQPYFVVHDAVLEGFTVKIDISPTVITNMINYGNFTLDPVRIPITNHTAHTNIALGLYALNNTLGHREYPISGFPRCFATEDSLKANRLSLADATRAKSRAVRRGKKLHLESIDAGAEHTRTSQDNNNAQELSADSPAVPARHSSHSSLSEKASTFFGIGSSSGARPSTSSLPAKLSTEATPLLSPLRVSVSSQENYSPARSGASDDDESEAGTDLAELDKAKELSPEESRTPRRSRRMTTDPEELQKAINESLAMFASR